MSAHPNVVVVVMDTARARDTVRSDRRDVALPALDRLASEGTEYTHAFAAAPWTLPSHAAVFTGTHSAKHGAHAGHKHLDDDLPTLAETFRSAGYDTVGISNNTWISEEFGFARGFDTFYKTWQYVQADTDLGEVARTERGTRLLRALAARLAEGNPVVNIANALYGQFFRKRTDDGARRTNQWLRSWLAGRTDDPFFAFVNYLEPHLEYRPPREIAERYLPEGVTYDDAMELPQDAWEYIAGDLSLTDGDFDVLHGLYGAEIAYLDRRIADLRWSLEAAGEWNNTVIVVTSDHGENVGDHGLMDHQYCLYDTLLHVPLVVAGGAFDGGHTNDDLVSLTDLAPTLLDAADLDAPTVREGFQGRSFHPDADADPREFVVAEYMAPQPSMAALTDHVGDSSENLARFDRSLRTIRTHDEKLILGSDDSREFYAVGSDPDESEDCAATESDRIEALETRLDDWLDSFSHADVSGTVSMTDSTKARLEDLGYIQ